MGEGKPHCQWLFLAAGEAGTRHEKLAPSPALVWGQGSGFLNGSIVGRLRNSLPFEVLAGKKECFDQSAVATNGHAGKPFVPFAFGNFRFGIEQAGVVILYPCLSPLLGLIVTHICGRTPGV